MVPKMKIPDFLPDKYQKLLYLKKRKSFQKGHREFFAYVREKTFRAGNLYQGRSDNRKHTYSFFGLSTIKMKFGQILVYLITNISKMSLAQCWILETSFRPF